MARIEKLAIDEGESSSSFMLSAGTNIAKKIIKLYPDLDPDLPKSKSIVLLLGRGNNAGDGFVCGSYLLKKGYKVSAFLFFDPSLFSDLCLKNYEIFKSLGGIIKEFKSCDDLMFSEDDLLIDAVFGTGFKGELPELLVSCFNKINLSKNIKVAIDIPSGLDGSSGYAAPDAIIADHTIYLSLPKSGFFLKNGWENVGVLHRVDFGLLEKYIEVANASFQLLEEDNIDEALPKIKRIRHKYEAGSVAAIAGSLGMEGAANLSGKAALRSGSGIVKIFMSGYKSSDKKEEIADELVKIDLSSVKKEEILSTCNKAHAVFIGPGIGRGKEMTDLLLYILPKITSKLVLDADGLYFLANNLSTLIPTNTIITPHRLEMQRLLHKDKNNLNEEDLFLMTQEFCEKHRVIIVLKGAPTFIFKADTLPVVISKGDPGMATAGSGDVLTGIITSLLSQKMEPYEAALLGTFIHGSSGALAASKKSSYSLIASDIIESLFLVFKNNK